MHHKDLLHPLASLSLLAGHVNSWVSKQTHKLETGGLDEVLGSTSIQ